MALQADCTAISATPSGLQLGNIDAGVSRTIVVPYSGTPHGDVTIVSLFVGPPPHFSIDAQARLFVSYTAADGLVSDWNEVFRLNMGLPLTVNVQDFFRPDW